MLNALKQPDLIFDKTVIGPSRRLSNFIGRVESYRQNMTSLSSIDTSVLDDKNEMEEKHVHFGKRTVHVYLNANAFPKEELWYSEPEMEQALKEDLTELRRANHQQMLSDQQLILTKQRTTTPHSTSSKRRRNKKSNTAMALKVKEISTRGLEKYVQNTIIHHRRVSQIYVRSVVGQYQLDHEPTLKDDKHAGSRKPRQHHTPPRHHCRRRTSKTTDKAQEAAFRLACEDEVAARRIYLEDGIVLDSAAFAAKRRSSLRAKATMAAVAARQKQTSGLRKSFVAKSA